MNNKHRKPVLKNFHRILAETPPEVKQKAQKMLDEMDEQHAMEESAEQLRRKTTIDKLLVPAFKDVHSAGWKACAEYMKQKGLFNEDDMAAAWENGALHERAPSNSKTWGEWIKNQNNNIQK